MRKTSVMLEAENTVISYICDRERAVVWGIEGVAATRRQWVGMAATFLGVLLIVSRGDWHNLRDFTSTPAI